MNHWLVTIAATAALMSSVPLAAAEDAELEAKIEAARERLDSAAKELAELHRKMGAEVHLLTRRFGDGPMLGVLLGGATADGVEVEGVTPGSGAEQAGLAAGDVLLAINGKPVARSPHKVIEALDGLEAGTSVAVDYRRDGKTNRADVTLQTGGFRFPIPNININVEKTLGGVFIGRFDGLSLHDLDANLAHYFNVDSGVLVLRAPKDSELKSGDIVRAVDNETPANAGDTYKRIASGTGSVMLDVLRDGSDLRLTVDRTQLQGPAPMLPMRRHGQDVQSVEIRIDDAATSVAPSGD